MKMQIGILNFVNDVFWPTLLYMDVALYCCHHCYTKEALSDIEMLKQM